METTREIQIATAIARIETKLDIVVKIVPRVEKLERWQAKVWGAVGAVTVILGIMGFKVFLV